MVIEWARSRIGRRAVPAGRGHERGQSLVEAMLMLILLISILSVFGQILFFELDVFNASTQARYNFFHQAHQDQLGQEPSDFNVTVQGKQISQAVPFTVLFQPSSSGIGNLRFGPRQYSGKRGTKTWTVITVFDGAIYAATEAQLLLDLYEDTAGTITDALGAISGPLNSALGSL